MSITSNLEYIYTDGPALEAALAEVRKVFGDVVVKLSTGGYRLEVDPATGTLVLDLLKQEYQKRAPQ